MKKALLAIGALYTLLGFVAFGQTCSTSSPCVGVSVTTTVPSNVGNSSVTLYKCSGGTTGCNATTLAQFIASSSAASQWSVAGTFPQKATTVTFNDPEPYGNLMNYAAVNTPTGGGAGPVSAILIFQVPNATQTAPTLVANPVLVTSGASGPQ